jgi:PBP1b-binding outer membrane lipoprotein LpoB
MDDRISLKPTWKRAALVTLGALALHGCSKESPQSPAPQAAVAAPAPAPATPPAPKPAPLDPVKLVHDVSCNSTRKTPKPDPTPEQRRAQQGKT